MKRYLTVLFFILIASCASAQMKRFSKVLSSFDALEVDKEFEVIYSAGNDYSVDITCEEPFVDYIIVEQKGAKLFLSVDEKKVPREVRKLYSGKNASLAQFKAMVTGPYDIETIVLNDKVRFSASTPVGYRRLKLSVGDDASVSAMEIHSEHSEIEVSNHGRISVMVQGRQSDMKFSGSSSSNVTYQLDSMKVVSSGAANSTLSGNLRSFNYESKGSGFSNKNILRGKASVGYFNMSGGCFLDASGLGLETAYVRMSSVCKLIENATDVLNVNLSGGATLVYGSNPSIQIENVKSSSIIKIENYKK